MIGYVLHFELLCCLFADIYKKKHHTYIIVLWYLGTKYLPEGCIA